MKPFLLLAALLVASVPAHAADTVKVVELFTSQGCASCPPADAYMAELAAKPDVIALSCHVTYWDSLGWKDTLGQEACTDRQKGYATVSASGKIYTPQMIVNGADEFVGSDRDRAEQSLAKNGLPSIGLSLDGAKGLKISLPQLSIRRQRSLTLWLFSYEKKHEQKIGQGENGGREVTYTNPVNGVIAAGAWDGSAGDRAIQIDGAAKAEGYAVLAQDNDSGVIVAAGKIEP